MPRLINVNVDLDAVDRATIIAALYHWRDSKNRPAELVYLACEFGAFTMLDDEEINDLVARIDGTA